MLAGSGCFTGADALGLPCVDNGDCGRGQTCIESFCGGPPSTGTTGASKSMSMSTSGQSTGGSDTVGMSSGGSTGLAEGCGSMLDPGADCDPQTHTSKCNADCTPALCGDGVLNSAAGEECEPTADTDDFFSPCTKWCHKTLFLDGVGDSDVTADLWQGEVPAVPPASSLPNDHGWRIVNGQWRTGVYSCASGVADLEFATEVMIDPAPSGMRAELRFRHRHTLDPQLDVHMCGLQNGTNDGGVVFAVTADDGALKLPGIYGNGIIDPGSECGPPREIPNPVTGPAFVGASGGNGLNTVAADLKSFEGKSIRIRFRMSYDCGNCGFNCAAVTPAPPPEYGWTVDQVAIGYVPDEDER